MQPGDIYLSVDAASEEGRYRPFKVLKLEPDGSGGEIAHIIVYARTTEPPSPATDHKRSTAAAIGRD